VVEVVTRLLDTLTRSGQIAPVDLATLLPECERRLINPSPRDMIVKEVLVDERAYVAGLERLLKLKKKIETDGKLFNDTLNRTFSSLTPIVDMQRRFLLGMEMTARKPTDKQNWARHFQDWSSMSSTYADFITSEKGAEEYIRTVLADRQRVEAGILDPIFTESLQLLCLPSQRIPKYSGFLQVWLPLLCPFLSDHDSHCPL
jgi:cell division control protein 24